MGRGRGWCLEGGILNGIRWAMTLVFIIAAVAHIAVPFVTIDSVTITLLAMACVPWVGRLFGKLEIPGLLKVEALEKARDRIVQSGLVPPADAPDDRQGRRHVYAFETVAAGDPNIVLAGFRIELEKRLREIAKSRGIAEDRRPLRRVIDDLAKRSIVRRDEACAIADLLPLLNSAVHGAAVDRAALDWALSFGPVLLNALEEYLGESSISDLMVQWRRRDGALFQEVGMDLSKALVKSPRAFLRAMADDIESFDSWVRGLEVHTFTVHGPDDELEDDLYTAYHERLKTLMQERLRDLVGSELDDQASRVLSALRGVTIQRIL